MGDYPNDKLSLNNNRPASNRQLASGLADGELFWLAFCYVAGELSPAQSLEFETRLEADQEAREAVAQAVELAVAGQVAAGQVAAGQTALEPCVELPSARRWSGGWALALAASLALVIAGYSLFGRNAAENGSSEPRQSDRRLADVWAASTWLEEDDAETGDESNRLTGWELTALDGDESAFDESELQVSEWLLEAVSSAQSVPAADSAHREG